MTGLCKEYMKKFDDPIFVFNKELEYIRSEVADSIVRNVSKNSVLTLIDLLKEDFKDMFIQDREEYGNDQCGREYAMHYKKCPMCVDCPDNCPLEK